MRLVLILFSVLVAFGALHAEDQPTSWSLAVLWKGKPIHPQPPAPDMERRYLDAGISPEAKAAVATAFDDGDWPTYQIPGPWESYGPDWNIDGEVVFRVAVDLPQTAAGKDLELNLGAIDDFDDTFFNGEQVGKIDKNVLGYWAVERVYRIPGNLVVAGKNVIAVRVFDQLSGGGFTGPKDKMLLRLLDAPKP